MHRVVAIMLLLCASALASGGHASHSSSTRGSAKNKTMHVHGYTRKDGTYVAPYDRSSAGTGTINQRHRPDYVAQGFTAHPSVSLDKRGRIKRSKAARAAFERGSPCPSTGKSRGRCPGYIVDHVRALECGGADNPSNMQWQTVGEAKVKDKTERECRL